MSNLCHKCFYEYDTPGSCPRCGYDATAELGKYPLALRPGSILGGRYIVGRVLGEGGFGITYSAQDYDSKDLVAIKEHFPAAIVTRTGRSSISLISESMKDAFLEGKQKFLDEAKTLSQFNGLDNICDIYSYFEENGTAYFAMEYVNGIALDDYIKMLGRLPSFEEAARLLLPVMDALSHVHEKGIIHRDISPDNIMVTPDGKVMLIDFGAARYAMGEKSRSLDVILKHGFAPMEQYNRHGRQGAYTDVYAMAATFYYSITGKVPQDALDRLYEDNLQPPSKLGIKIPKRAETALMKALTVHFNQRWQSIREFSEIIRKELPPSKAELEAKRRAEEERKAAERRAKEEEKAREAEKRAEAQRLKELKKAEKAQKNSAAESPKKKKPLALIAAIAAIAIGAGAFFAMGGDKAKLPAIDKNESSVIVSDTPAPTEEASEITWELSERGKTLTISGEGPMEDWNGYCTPDNAPPWQLEWRVHLGIERVIIDDGISHIGSNSFIGCTSLKSVTIPLSVTSIGEGAFQMCNALETVHYEGTDEQWDKIDIGQHNSLLRLHPAEKKEYPLAEITWQLSGDTLTISGEGRMGAYSGYKGSNPAPWCVDGVREYIKKVVISPGITHVTGLLWLENMTEVELPDTVIFVGSDAFFNTPSLRTIIYNGSAEDWENVDILVPANVQVKTKVVSGTYGENISWKLDKNGTLTISGEGEIPHSYEQARPFEQQRSEIKKIVVEEGITSIGSSCFRELPALEELVLPRGLKTIGQSSFRACKELRYVYFPDGLTSIGKAAFEVCSSLGDISLPSTLREIESNAFNIYGSDLKKIIFRGSEKQWSSISIAGYVPDRHSETFYIAEKIFCEKSGNAGAHTSWALAEDGTLYILGGESMENYKEKNDAPWYDHRTEIRSINISHGISSISENAFSDCKTDSVRIPKTVTSIGEAAFYGCSHLQNIFYAGNWDSWNACNIAEDNNDLLAAEKIFTS